MRANAVGTSVVEGKRMDICDWGAPKYRSIATLSNPIVAPTMRALSIQSVEALEETA